MEAYHVSGVRREKWILIENMRKYSFISEIFFGLTFKDFDVARKVHIKSVVQ